MTRIVIILRTMYYHNYITSYYKFTSLPTKVLGKYRSMPLVRACFHVVAVTFHAKKDAARIALES